MNLIYFAVDMASVLVLMIMLYAILFENRQPSKKRTLFIHLTATSLAVVLADAITYLNLGWDRTPVLFWILLAVPYILPFLTEALFGRYLYVHIAEKTDTKEAPFHIIYVYSAVGAVVGFFMCLSGELFAPDGAMLDGPMETAYYAIYMVAMVYIIAIMLVNRKKLGTHDFWAALSFCLFPLISFLISLFNIGIDLAVPFMGLDVLVIYITLQSERARVLMDQATNDELTGLYNRRAYESDMMQYPDVPVEMDFIYASVDVNSLKQVNDTLGHAAGDELLCGVAYCLKRSLGNYGKVYRTGGDEFVSMFFADEEHFRHVAEELQELTDTWSGELADTLSISVGYATKREFRTETVEEMAKIAEKRMYREKEHYYETKGMNRRGQSEAQRVLCALYTKILRINLKDDTYVIINMDENEVTHAGSISAWLESFGKSGGVHPDDLAGYMEKTNLSYMRNYFATHEVPLTVLYRRNYSGVYKRVMMEIVPTKNYAEDGNLFLYVKGIE